MGLMPARVVSPSNREYRPLPTVSNTAPVGSEPLRLVPSLLQSVVAPSPDTKANLKRPCPVKFTPFTATRPW